MAMLSGFVSMSSCLFEGVCPARSLTPVYTELFHRGTRPRGHSPHRDPAFSATETSSLLISVLPQSQRPLGIHIHTHTYLSHTQLLHRHTHLSHTHTLVTHTYKTVTHNHSHLSHRHTDTHSHIKLSHTHTPVIHKHSHSHTQTQLLHTHTPVTHKETCHTHTDISVTYSHTCLTHPPPVTHTTVTNTQCYIHTLL